MQERFFSPGMQPGTGVDLLDGTALEQGVIGAVTPPDAAGQHVESRIVRIDDIASLHTLFLKSRCAAAGY
jgi:hypothetical protein